MARDASLGVECDTRRLITSCVVVSIASRRNAQDDCVGGQVESQELDGRRGLAAGASGRRV